METDKEKKMPTTEYFKNKYILNILPVFILGKRRRGPI